MSTYIDNGAYLVRTAEGIRPTPNFGQMRASQATISLFNDQSGPRFWARTEGRFIILNGMAGLRRRETLGIQIQPHCTLYRKMLSCQLVLSDSGGSLLNAEWFILRLRNVPRL